MACKRVTEKERTFIYRWRQEGESLSETNNFQFVSFAKLAWRTGDAEKINYERR